MIKEIIEGKFEEKQRRDVRNIGEMLVNFISPDIDTRFEVVEMLLSMVDRIVAVHGVEKLKEKIEIN